MVTEGNIPIEFNEGNITIEFDKPPLQVDRDSVLGDHGRQGFEIYFKGGVILRFIDEDDAATMAQMINKRLGR